MKPETKPNFKISIITVCFNAAATIAEAIRSVCDQSYQNVEHIIVDGNSNDGTQTVITNNFHSRLTKFVSEPDNGIFDAMNKGLTFSGGGIIGFLNADDFYTSPTVLETVAKNIELQGVDSCYGDLLYVDKKDTSKVVRYWRSTPFSRGQFRTGWMPPHPTFFVKKSVYEKFGHFYTTLRVSADYELMLRFLERHGISTHYIPEAMVKMRIGGNSNKSLWNRLRGNYEAYQAWKLNHLSVNPLTIFLKPLRKLPQFIMRPSQATN